MIRIPHMKKVFIIGFLIGCLGFPAGSLLQAQEGIISDTLLKKFSVEELVQLRKLLAKQRERLLREQQKSQATGLELSQEFIGKSREENSNQDKILIRVAEYYYEEALLEFDRRMEEYERRYQEYEKLLKAFEEGKIKTPPIEPKRPQHNFEKAIAIYDIIINSFPESDLVDDALYNKAYLLKEMGEWKAAEQVFQQIIDQYQESRYAPEAYMELAERYFNPEPGDSRETTILKLNKAVRLYKNVLQYKDSPRYAEALYKLGWSYYRLAGADPDYYTDAIVYFMAVVRDIERLKELDPTGELVRADVEPEALEFIAASFIDTAYSKSGVANARAFLEKLGKPSYGVQIMEKIGDRYAKITLWDKAIEAYRELLDMYPDYAYAPRIQKKIADAYLADQKFELAFEERNKLFENYNPHSEWYAQIEQQDIPDRITILDEAYRLTEEALRANINYLLSIAQTAEANQEDPRPKYEEFVKLARFYLENFPTDENAYEINWALAYVLDAKLGRFAEAFEEYIRVSNDYLEDAHRLDAAENAIVVADTLVRMARMQRDTTRIAGADFGRLPPQELSPEEKMLAEAYDNFIKLFPDSPQTPRVLADAGALYYNHRQFDLAKKYYKTMVTKFPKAQQKSIGLVSLMNSYFFLGQYLDAEIVAKKILESPNVPEDQAELARRRIGESIYKNAEKLEQQSEYLEAAKEYFRVFTDARDYVKFADMALFKSAYNYEQAGEWLKAIEMYNVLVDNFPESKYVLPALGNIAEDYKELGEYDKVAAAYERIYQMFPNTKDAEVALYNASLFYAKAENWAEAIRVNKEYIRRYPGNPESKDLLFENAGYYLKLGDLKNANKIFAEFAALYPDDPLAVEAFYRRGEYYFERARYDSAKVEFQNAIRKSNEFARIGKDPNLYYAAESYYKLAEILNQEYKAIKLSYPPANARAQLIRKRDKLKELQEAYARVIELGSIRGFEAMFRIAEAFEELANAIAYQELPDNLTREQALVEQNKIFRASVPAYDKAVEEYKNVLINMPVLAEKFGISLTEAELETMEEAPPTAPEDTAFALEKAVEEDSTREVAIKWYTRAKEKISEILYSVAERSSFFVKEYLRTPNPNTGLQALVYEDLVLRNLVVPAVQTTINAHYKNIQVSEELGLENKYVVESRRMILLTNNIISEQYAKLFYQSAELYQQNIPVLEELVERGEGATTPEGLDYYDFQDEVVMQTIYYMDQFSKRAITNYENTIKFAVEHNIENDAKLTTEEKLFNFAYESSDLMEALSKAAEQKAEYYINKFDTLQNPRYQLASTFFDDQSVELVSYSQEVLETAYDVSKNYQIENIWTKLILAKLVELDPATYLVDLPKEEYVVQSDTTWKATTRYDPGYNFWDYDDSGWGYATMVAVPFDTVFQVFDSLGVSPPAIWVSRVELGGRQYGPTTLELTAKEETDTLLAETEMAPVDTTLDTAMVSIPEPDTLTAYFRKTFYLDSEPIDGYLAVTADKTFYVYLNDNYLIGSDDHRYHRVEIIPFEALKELVHQGDNLIAVSVTDYDGPPRYGLRFYLVLKLLPKEITETLARLRKVQETEADPVKLKRVVILNRNQIIE